MKRISSTCNKIYKEEDEIDELTTSNATVNYLSNSDTAVTLGKIV
jgi:hypothetical protein